jgi:hypothetical protein
MLRVHATCALFSWHQEESEKQRKNQHRKMLDHFILNSSAAFFEGNEVSLPLM